MEPEITKRMKKFKKSFELEDLVRDTNNNFIDKYLPLIKEDAQRFVRSYKRTPSKKITDNLLEKLNNPYTYLEYALNAEFERGGCQFLELLSQNPDADHHLVSHLTKAFNNCSVSGQVEKAVKLQKIRDCFVDIKEASEQLSIRVKTHTEAIAILVNEIHNAEESIIGSLEGVNMGFSPEQKIEHLYAKVKALSKLTFVKSEREFLEEAVAYLSRKLFMLAELNQKPM